ncbi:MAG: hypothetical protein ACK4MD_03090 [Demequina sp.]
MSGSPTRHNGRAVIGIVLSGLGLAWAFAAFSGVPTPPLAVFALGIGGLVMGLRGRAAVRDGTASNDRLARAAAFTGLGAIVGGMGIFVLVLLALDGAAL